MLVARIAHVRFDGQMSSKRRQETIIQFSVPLNDDPGSVAAMDTSDEEFLGNAVDDCVFSGKKSSRNKSKGKGKSSTNPKVMLLSLKAVCHPFSLVLLHLKNLQGAVGLNLTGTNIAHDVFSKAAFIFN